MSDCSIGFIFESPGRRLGILGGYFDGLGVNLGIISAVVGVILATRGSPGTPKTGRGEKVAEKWFVDPPSFTPNL